MNYTDERSGISFPVTSSFAAALARLCEEDKHATARWVERLRAEGIKAAHPDDGWHNRNRHEFTLVYPDFNDAPQVGDRVALGNFREHRVVTVSGVRNLLLGGKSLVYQYEVQP